MFEALIVLLAQQMPFSVVAKMTGLSWYYAYSLNRNGEHPQQHLANFRGILQANGYANFAQIYADELVFQAACWAHARRKFEPDPVWWTSC